MGKMPLRYQPTVIKQWIVGGINFEDIYTAP